MSRTKAMKFCRASWAAAALLALGGLGVLWAIAGTPPPLSEKSAPAPEAGASRGPGGPRSNRKLANTQPPLSKKSAQLPVVGARQAPVGQLYQLKLANKLIVPVYPHDPLAPWDNLTWHAPLPFTVVGVKYEPGQRELWVDLDFSIGTETEKSLLDKLVLGYQLNGRPGVKAAALSLVRLELVAWTVALEVEGQQIQMYSTPASANSMPTRRKVSFTVPMAPQYDRLHRRLSSDPAAVNVVFRACYPFHSLAGGTIQARVLASAFEAVREKMVGPKGENPGHEFLVSREGLAKVKNLLRQEVREKVSLFAPEEDRGWVLDQLDKMLARALDRLAQPMDLVKLHELGENALVWTVKNGQVEVAPNQFNDLITKSKEYAKEEQDLMTRAEALSDIAHNDKVSDKQFKQACQRMALELSASAQIAIFGGGNAKFNLATSWDSMTRNEREEVHSARSFIRNKSEYMSSVRREFLKVVEGQLKKHGSVAKVLNISRISRAALMAENIGGGSIAWVNGVETVALERPLPLMATQAEKDNDVLAGMLERMRLVEGKLASLKRTVAENRLVVEEGTWQIDGNWSTDSKGKLQPGKSERIPVKFAKPFKKAPKLLVSITLFDAQGKPQATPDVRVVAEPLNISRKGFSLHVGTYSESIISHLSVRWIAIGQ